MNDGDYAGASESANILRPGWGFDEPVAVAPILMRGILAPPRRYLIRSRNASTLSFCNKIVVEFPVKLM